MSKKAKHDYRLDSYFVSTCKKCGCIRQREKNNWPPKYEYVLNGQVTKTAPDCLPVKKQEPEVKQLTFFR